MLAQAGLSDLGQRRWRAPARGLGAAEFDKVAELIANVLKNTTPVTAASGLPGYEIVGWHGIFAPAGTPRDVVERLSATIGKILATPDIRDLWNTQAMETAPSSPELFAKRLQFDYDRYGKLIKDANIKVN